MQLRDAMNDLQEQVKVEHAPTEKNEHGVEVSKESEVARALLLDASPYVTKFKLNTLS